MKLNKKSKGSSIEYDPGAFKYWILKNSSLSPKAASDVVSRLNRIKKHVEIDATSNPEKIVNQIRHHPDFQRASTAVFSQLKNALTKYTAFIKELKD